MEQPAARAGPCPERPIRPEDVPFDAHDAGRLLAAVVDVCRKHGSAAEPARVQSAGAGEPGLPLELMRYAAFGPDDDGLALLADRLEVSAAGLLLFGRVLAAPPVTYLARKIRQAAEAELPSEDNCPVCGSTPALAHLRREDGKRVLHCSLCAHGWPFARLRCPFCGNEDQAALGMLSVQGEEGRWIETCQHCRHYVKTVDLRGLSEEEPFIPLAEEAATLYLDMLADKEGWARKPPYAAIG
jgi:formate dehydrogenase accessory protein FdhE